LRYLSASFNLPQSSSPGALTQVVKNEVAVLISCRAVIHKKVAVKQYDENAALAPYEATMTHCFPSLEIYVSLQERAMFYQFSLTNLLEFYGHA